ncbi:Hydrolase, TatD family [Aphelenchoides besseyi]|nr:Hydrolase, TatD family [Aphelenchoides besseyi]
MSESKKAANDDKEMCSKIRKFYPIYYQALDTEREKLQYLYSSNAPTLTWNGHHVIGVSAITAFLEQLPVTDHNVINVNPQNMEVDGQSWALVSVLGNVAIAGENHGFSQKLVVCVQNIPVTSILLLVFIHMMQKEWSNEVQKEIISLAADPNCVAIGETGLDFNRNFSPRDQQRTAFEEQVKIACDLKKSLFIHERDAHDDLMEILSRYADRLPPAVIHCFTGTAAQAKAYIDKGFFIGLTGFLWKDKSDDGVRHALQNGIIPLDRLLLETDAPYMYCKVNDKKIPATIREKISDQAKQLHSHSSFQRNEPSGLAASCELIAAFAGVKAEELARITTENAKRVYGLN